jgi:predicted HAD superfamily phosphohydrolase YqeG
MTEFTDGSIEEHLPTQEIQQPEDSTRAESGMVMLRSLETPKIPSLSLTPDYRAHNISRVDFGFLHEQGLETVLLDLDQTVTPTNGTEIRPDLLPHLLENQTSGNIKDVYIATDRRGNVTSFTEPLGAKRIDTPLLRRKYSQSYWNGVRRRLEDDGRDPSHTVIIGDSRWDVKGGNSIGLTTIAVEPFSGYARIEHLVNKPRRDEKWRAGLDERYGREMHPPLTNLRAVPKSA